MTYRLNSTLMLYTLMLCCVFCSKSEEEMIEEPNASDASQTPVVDPQPADPIPVIRTAIVPCDNGLALEYPCSGYRMVGKVSLPTLGSTFANDNWGWEDPETGKEYVMQGLNDGVAFLDVSSPTAIRYVGKLPTATRNSTWRDIKVHSDHAYIVSEADDHGLQVFDLRRLRGQTEFQTFTHDARITQFGSAHNIAINQDSGYAYAIGAQNGSQYYYGGGPVFIDISTPSQPQVVGGYAGSSYTHDAHVVNYSGPDPDYQGREILFGSNSDGGENNKVVIVDVTDKQNPRLIAQTTYGSGGYTHQGWVDENQRYFYLGDELDEMRYGNRTRTLVFDLEDLDNPQLHYTYEGVTNAIDHNGYTLGDSFYIANYTAGFREIDISNIANQQMTEVGFFDTYPLSNSATFDGVWNVYPFFTSGIIAISDTGQGLFLVQANE